LKELEILVILLRLSLQMLMTRLIRMPNQMETFYRFIGVTAQSQNLKNFKIFSLARASGEFGNRKSGK
jgi:hypothetical protein